MPHYDKRRGDLIIRVVYDGAPEAGKTTNVRQLCDMLSLQRRGELTSPGTVGRRTEFFDWMDFAGGYLDGHRLRCQLVTVPGQASLLRRRRYLLETADVVIFVADSHPLLVEENRDGFVSLEGALARVTDAPVSIVLQANKQDRPNALSASELARRMGVHARTPAIAARADRGEGVKESFFLAVRLAAERVRALSQQGAISVGTLEVGESADGLYELMLAREVAEAPPPEADVASTAAHETEAVAPLEPPIEEPPSAASSSPVSTTERPAPSVAPPEPPRAPSVAPPSIVVPEPQSATVPVVEISEPARDVTAPPPPRAYALPDSSQAPAGCVWPPMTGRALCASAHGAIATLAAGRRAWAPSDAIELTTDRAIVFHTREAWCWPSLEAARLALLAEIRALLPLRDVLPEDRAVVLGADGDAWRLWAITPDVPTLADEIRTTLATGPEAAIADRCVDAWRVVRGKLGARVHALHPSMVGKTRSGWALLAFGDALEHPAAPASVPAGAVARVLAQRLDEAGAWPTLRAELGAIDVRAAS